MDIVHSYTAAVRGIHYYKHFWKLIENEELPYLHEKFNFYDSFALKTVRKNGDWLFATRAFAGNNFFLDKGVSMHVKLSSCHYRRSPLVQGGMRIRCTVFFSMTSTLKNAQLAERYLQLVKERYLEPAN